MDALLFRLTAADGPPEWKVCADDWIDFYTDRGWFLLASEREVVNVEADDRSAIEQVRDEEVKRWGPPTRRRWRPRVKRHGTTGE